MKNFFSDIKAGDKVFIDCDAGFVTAGDYETVTETKTKYDEDTGEAYKVICCDDHHFDARSGCAITPPLAYYISIPD